MPELPPPSPDTAIIPPPPVTEFKPNIYPIMYWALAFGVSAGVLLFLMYLLSQIITIVWFPVFLVGLLWGAYRNYEKQKKEWLTTQGMTPRPQSPVTEFREAMSDILYASRDLMTQEEAPVPPAESAVSEQPEEPAPPAKEPSAPTPPPAAPIPPAPPV